MASGTTMRSDSKIRFPWVQFLTAPLSPRCKAPNVIFPYNRSPVSNSHVLIAHRHQCTCFPCASSLPEPYITPCIQPAHTPRLFLSLFFSLQKFLAFVLLFWERRVVVRIATSNLVAHRLRNRKTMIMYALSLAFIVFITVAATQQIEASRFRRMYFSGAPVTYVLSAH